SLFAVRPEDAAPPARIHTLSLPDALPILTPWSGEHAMAAPPTTAWDSEWVSVRTGPSWSGVRAAVRSEDRGGTVTAGRSAAAALRSGARVAPPRAGAASGPPAATTVAPRRGVAAGPVSVTCQVRSAVPWLPMVSGSVTASPGAWVEVSSRGSTVTLGSSGSGAWATTTTG